MYIEGESVYVIVLYDIDVSEHYKSPPLNRPTSNIKVFGTST